MAWESNSYPKPGGRNQKFTRTIKTAELGNLDEGTYFLKVDAYDQNGALMTQRRPVDPDAPDGRAENESDYFFVTSGVLLLALFLARRAFNRHAPEQPPQVG